MTTVPGPTSIDSAVVSHNDISNLRDRRDWLIQMHAEHKKRVEVVTYVSIGEWQTVWPDLSETPEVPTVANQVELGINHWGAVGGAILPSIKVPINKSADRRVEKPAVRRRERRVKELWEASNMSEIAALLWQDYAGAGAAIMGAWCNFEEEDLTKRNPYIMRFDPRHTFPIKDAQGNITELLVARKIGKGELVARYPEWKQLFKEADDEQVEEWFWYTKDRVSYQIVDVSKSGRKANRNLTLVDEEWKLGFVPAWEINPPSFDGQRRGLFDQALHILRTMQRLMLLTIISTEENAFPAIGVYDVANPEDFGPGATIHFRSAESKLTRLGPENHFDIKDLIARLGVEAAKQAVQPQQLSGEPGASIVSARGITASMGALDARLAVAHKQFEVGFGKVSGFLLAMDETFCNVKKPIVGDMRDTSDSEEYFPERDVAGSWIVNCTYGIGAGSDPNNIEVRLNMNLANGLLSRETAREQLPFLEDPDAEPVRQLREALQDGIVQGIMAMSQQGDPTMAAKALELLQEDTLDFDEVLAELVSAILAPPDQAPSGDPGTEVLQGAESLARGGVPGQAAQAPPAGGLPPLGAILGQDSRQVT